MPDCHTQELFENLQITDGTLVDVVAFPWTRIRSRESGELPTHTHFKTEVEMAKLFAMAASMRCAPRSPENKRLNSSTNTEMPAPVRFSRANRKMAAVKDL